MKTVAIAAAFLVLFAACAAKPTPSPTTGAAAERETRRRQTIAVYPFDNNAVTGRERLDFLREWLPDVVGEALRQSGELRLVERRELLQILQEQKLGASALASKEARIQIGKIAGAQTLVFGGFTAIGDTLQMDARIVDAESSVVLKTVAVRGATAGARALGQELAEKVSSGLGFEVARRTAAAGVSGSFALQAAEHFYRGLALEKEGKTEEAIESYRKTLEINRDDEEAKAHLKRLLTSSP